MTSTSVGDKPADAQALVEALTGSLRQTAEAVVPWFIEQMPLMYFQDTDQATRIVHLQAIIAAKASGRPIELTLRRDDGSVWTFMRPRDYPGVLAELVAQLPHDRPLRAAKIHTAADGQLVLDTFEFGETAAYDSADPQQARKLAETIEYVQSNDLAWTPADVADHLARCRSDYVTTVTPLRICTNWELFNEVSETDGTAVRLEPEADPSQCRITVAVGNATTRVMLERLATRLSRSSINIHRAYLDILDDGPHGPVILVGFVVQGPDGGPIDPDGALWHTVRADLLRNKWLDARTLELVDGQEELSTSHAEIITGLADLAHQVLVKSNPFAYSPDRILRLATRNLDQTRQVADLLLSRFNPAGPLDDATFERRSQALRVEIDNEVDLEESRVVLATFVDAVQAVLRTNIFLEHRYGLAFRLDPAFLAGDGRPELPFGVFYVHGRDFNGFHVRFRDIARGGVRAIRPIGADQHAREAERLYDEAYHLAFAQQLKNKDIPEGGAKAAILLASEAPIDRCVKAFVNCLLDLVTTEAETCRHVVDHLGRTELLYLGPDENITPDLIEWIVAQARRRGYSVPASLMSSKPGAGINHKEYGVTSEGVNVFLDVVLRSAGIDPGHQPFTVKITGGPDGDVAGNLVRILHRDYGDRARIVGVADGSGTAEDHDGLDHAELLRLVDAEAPIGQFDRSRLGPRGRLVTLDEPDGVHLRNTMHNRVVADAFVPCGGRPNTVHGGNWRDYLDEQGQPTSRVIVEGANLFFTPEARNELAKLGVLILKDSSANKCGVICSSFEIIACMLLSEDEFLGIKDRFVQEVVQKLRTLARREAELLARFHQYHPHVPLPEMSTRLSRVMIRAADAIEAAIENLHAAEPDLVRRLVLDHLPPVLVEQAGERLWTNTPRPYLMWIMAKSLAARIVYREGIEYLEEMPRDAIARLASRYLALELERQTLIEALDRSDLPPPQRQRIADLLSRAGILSTLD
ncbi:MAG: NAD-glutamate dehydrogenase domain-containing protein [Planctomycetota bacterium]